MKFKIREYKINISKDDWFMAVKRGNIELIKQYLDNGFDINCQNSLKNTALIYACFYKNLNLVKELLKYSDININLVDSIGDSAIMLACLNDEIEIVDELLKQPNIDLNIRDASGNTILTYAKMHKNRKMINLLKKAGAIE